MHKLYTIIQDVEKTHHNLGNAVAFSAICIKARICLLIVSPAGCGKSVVSEAIGATYPTTIRMDSVTRSGLRDFKEEFTNFKGLVVIDDMGKIDSSYNRRHTISSFAELCYSHFISKHTMAVTLEIADFFGSAILNIQPSILAEVYEFAEWESVIQDKTCRYYHLYRPTIPMDSKPSVSIDWGIDLDKVKKPDHRYKMYPKLDAVAGIQWSDARVLEHLDKLLQATAALDRRDYVSNEDMVLLHKLMKPMSIERYIFKKYGFETGRHMETNLAAVLVEFASWRNITIERIARDYKISPSTVYSLLVDIREWFEESSVASKRLVPTAALKKVLKEAGVEK